MPSTVNNLEIKRKPSLFYYSYFYFLVKQLIPPRPQATRGKPFPLNGSEEWFVYPHGKNVYLYNFKDKSVMLKKDINVIKLFLVIEGI